jgi:adenosylmethionine-8-amino-7-oxononanoate aminotransferase
MLLSQRDKQVIWHPYTQMKDAQAAGIVRGEGAHLYDETGKRYIDAISSWWTNIHGHAHPYIAEKVGEQLKTLEHVIFAGFTHEPAVRLAERLLELLPGRHSRIFYSDNGSTAVEVALKMAFQYWHNKGELRNKVIAFKNAYHGDTFGAMSVSGRGPFNAAFEKFLFDVIYIDAPVPGMEDTALGELQSHLRRHGAQVASFIFEPLVQGTAGMVMHEPGHLQKMMDLCQAHGIICIADEVMTGFGRTGKMFAMEMVKAAADITCLSKGLTGGAMALGVTSCTQKIYEAFLSDDRLKTFFHGHSYTANPVACAAGNASLDLFEKEGTIEKAVYISKKHQYFADGLVMKPVRVAVRQQGTILAIEVRTGESTSYFNAIRDRAYAYFLEKGILMRPLGNVIYLMPPYCISDTDLAYIYGAIEEFLSAAL